ncbi:uncharacterized protein PHACADRAFT_261266 [Phanerochaete carnosa HHB-10118-sp]|uniref:HPt domain-containing protein n=1 Tax=Phanerochaete carnosa (strain HHB-10118-sp) TaxID=650164 RepID=K5WQN7_PHACS|nr:uncharacterized protein PHACADRAFT_261266 [Phanerochaete carnosa HHB-10118-sp]EKM52677.1 hypothetical protein PHACADRAFT_261266 [Phanerochaete carnosa HHB-10118-sp]
MSRVSSPRRSEDTPKPVQSLPTSANGRVSDTKLPASTSSKPSVVASPPASPAAKRAVSEAPSAHSEDSDEFENESTVPVEGDKSNIINMEIFQQILELDEDDQREFSSEMVSQFFDQASNTFEEMDEAFQAKDLLKLESLGHFLKGSSAALGVHKVQATCEKIQNYGKMSHDEFGESLTETEALNKIDPLLKSGKVEYTDAEEWLRSWYKKQGVALP